MIGSRFDPRALREVRTWFSKTLRIARWEFVRSVDGFDRRTAAFALGLFVLAGGVVVAGVDGGVAFDRDVYRVGVAPENPYYEPVAQSTALSAGAPSAAAFERRELDILVGTDRIRAVDTPKGRAALAAFRSAVESYNDRRLAAETDETAAFPVRIELRYVDRDGAGDTAGDPAAGRSEANGDGPNAVGDDGARMVTETGVRKDAEAHDDGARAVSPLGREPSVDRGSPTDIAPPFPFESLVLAFLILVPMNVVAQFYGSSFLTERTNRRGELLLASPVRPSAIVAGKSLPYLLGTAVVVTIIAVAVGGGPVSVAAAMPIAFVFLAATFLAALLARSFKELTFVTVAVSVVLTAYAFVPAVFADVTPIALISPLTLVVRDLGNEAVTAGEYAFSTGPFYCSGLVLFVLGIGLYREEDLFARRPLDRKLLDALAARLVRPRSVALWSALLVPFVFVVELFAIALLFVLPIDLAVIALLVVVATVEELAKSVHVYAGISTGRFDRTLRGALSVGVLSGLGFFVGEKFTLLAQTVGLADLALGRAAFGPGVTDPVALAALSVAPLALHAVTASISAVGATRGRTAYVPALAVAIVVHAAYNLAVVSAVG